MRNFKILLFIISFLAFLWGCQSPHDYLSEALQIIQEHSIMRDSINWNNYKKEVFQHAKDAENIEETYPSIRFALDKLNDNHSLFLTTDEQKKRSDKKNKNINLRCKLIRDSVGYLNVPGVSGNRKSTKDYAKELLDNIKELDSNYVKGWVIDLRANTGGNMWPMLLGMGPILGEDTAGYFVDNKKNYNSWNYSNGKIFINNKEIMSLDETYSLRNQERKIAVLISGKTSSSGEAVVVSFKGKPKTKFFGRNTQGLSTANKGYRLSDGAMIYLTSAIFADRNKDIYGESIQPDKNVENPKAHAIEWILQEK